MAEIYVLESVLTSCTLDRAIHASAFHHFLVLFFQTDFIVVYRVVVIAEVHTRLPFKYRVDKREIGLEVRGFDLGKVQQGMENMIRGDGGIAVVPGNLVEVRAGVDVIVREPDHDRDMQLVVSRDRRGVQESLPAVVQQVFPVVGRIEHGGIAAGIPQYLDHVVQEIIRVADAVIISVDQLVFVLVFDLGRVLAGVKWANGSG